MWFKGYRAADKSRRLDSSANSKTLVIYLFFKLCCVHSKKKSRLRISFSAAAPPPVNIHLTHGKLNSSYSQSWDILYVFFNLYWCLFDLTIEFCFSFIAFVFSFHEFVYLPELITWIFFNIWTNLYKLHSYWICVYRSWLRVFGIYIITWSYFRFSWSFFWSNICVVFWILEFIDEKWFILHKLYSNCVPFFFFFF